MSVIPPHVPTTERIPTSESPRRSSSRQVPADPILTAALDAMADEWAAGRGRPAETWLAEHPELQANPELATQLVYEELCLREDRGEDVSSAEFYRRFPQWRETLAALLKCHHFLQHDSGPAEFPEAGETLGEFELQEELGRGALGRVFLATQHSLSDRPLVVKLTARRGHEHLSLARLQQTHIVPLYLVQDFPDSGLRALCMPYLGGQTWHSILHGLREHAIADRSGAQIAEQLIKARRQEDPSFGKTGPALGFLSRSKYVEAICWIGACLADALHYAHQRGLAHLDVKPSNILLAADGQPMLLDFHLASEIERLRRKELATIGGTPGYTSPEQRSAMDAIRRSLPVKDRIDGRSDIYSLAVVLYESLAGCLPPADPSQSRAALRRANPGVSRGLEDILHKCLAHDPADRYRDAGELAVDLRCHLANLPLRTVANHSPLERLRKWRRRRPSAMPLAIALTAAIVIGAIFVNWQYRLHVHSAEGALSQSQHELTSKHYERAVSFAESGQRDLRWFPWQVELRNRLERAAAVGKLHDLVDQLRFLDDKQLSNQALANVAARFRQIWDIRQSFLISSENSIEEGPGSEISRQLRRDLVDLAILSARMEVRLASPANLPAARQTGAKILAEAIETCGDNPVLQLEQRDFQNDRPTSVNGSAALAAAIASLPKDADAWEHCGFGRWLMHHGAYAEAEKQLAAAIDIEPSEFWAHFQLLRCQFELAQFDAALRSAEVCVALEPDRAECFYNRGLCHGKLGQSQDALDDFSRALKRDPKSAPAMLERGILLGRLGRYSEAESDLKSALQLGSKPGEAYYHLARLSLDRGDREAARQWIAKSLTDDPANPAAIALKGKL